MKEADNKIFAWTVAGVLGMAFLGGVTFPLVREIAKWSRNTNRVRQPWDVP